jgi:plasmid stabilization system protein ParE
MRVVFRHVAREDLEEAHAWYEQQRPGLGERLEEAVQQVLDRIAATPMMHPCIHKDVRRALVFPHTASFIACCPNKSA